MIHCQNCDLPLGRARIADGRICTPCLKASAPKKPEKAENVVFPLPLKGLGAISFLRSPKRVFPGGTDIQKPWDRPAKKRRCNPNGKPIYLNQSGFRNPARAAEKVR